MNDEPDPVRRDWLLEVAAGSRPPDDPELAAACAHDPDFASKLRDVVYVRDQLAALRRAEAGALAAGPSPLEAMAVAAARAQLAAPARVVRRWPWLALALAAGLVLWLVVFRGDGSGPQRPTHLGGEVRLSFAASGTELVFDPAPLAGQHYVVEFVAGGTVVQPRLRVATGRVSLPDLRQHPAPVLVRALLMQGGEEIGRSGEVPVPAGSGK